MVHGMSRFVILRHEVPASFPGGSHWDLMLEQPTDLMTWSLPELPEPQHTVAVEALAPHRKLYLDYEGSVSGDRGHVRQWDTGSLCWLEQHADRITVQVEGRHLRGIIELRRNGTSDSGWDLTYSPQETTDQSSIDESSPGGEPPVSNL